MLISLLMLSCLFLQWNGMETRWDKVTIFIVQAIGSYMCLKPGADNCNREKQRDKHVIVSFPKWNGGMMYQNNVYT